MFRNRLWRISLACGLPLAVGCAEIPDVVADAARASAKEALEETMDDLVNGVVDQTIGGFLDFEDLEIPFVDEFGFQIDESADDVEGFEIVDDDAELSDDVDQGDIDSDEDSGIEGGRR